MLDGLSSRLVRDQEFVKPRRSSAEGIGVFGAPRNEALTPVAGKN